MTIFDQIILRSAAEELRLLAADIRACHTVNGKWPKSEKSVRDQWLLFRQLDRELIRISEGKND
jgi:hypothetical protein